MRILYICENCEMEGEDPAQIYDCDTCGKEVCIACDCADNDGTKRCMECDIRLSQEQESEEK